MSYGLLYSNLFTSLFYRIKSLFDCAWPFVFRTFSSSSLVSICTGGTTRGVSRTVSSSKGGRGGDRWCGPYRILKQGGQGGGGQVV